MTRISKWVSATGVAAALALAVTWVVGRDPDLPPVAADANAVAGGSSVVAARAALPIEMDRAEPQLPEAGLLWRIVDASGVPVANVSIFDCEVHSRYGRGVPVASSDSNGIVRMPRAGVAEARELLAVHGDFVTQRLESAASTGVDVLNAPIVVVLKRTPPQSIRVTDRAGAPVPGLVVLASADAIGPLRDKAMEEEAWHPGGDPRTAVFRSRSDPYGIAVLKSLPVQGYHLVVASDSWALDLPMQIRVHAMPGVPIDLVVLQPHVAVLEFDPEMPRHRITMSSPDQMLDSVRYPEIARWREKLETRYPKHSVFLAMRRDGKAEPMGLRGEALTDQGTMAKFSAQAVRLAEFQEPAKVLVDAPAGLAGGSAAIALDDSLLPYSDKLVLRLFDTEGRLGFVYLKPGEVNPVPAGKYEFECSSQGIGHLIARMEVEVVPGVQVRLPVAPRAQFRVVRFHTETPPGRPVPGIEILVTNDPPNKKVREAYHNGPWNGSCEMLIPAGKYRVRARTEKFEVLWTDLEVDLASKAPIDVPLVLVPKVK